MSDHWLSDAAPPVRTFSSLACWPMPVTALPVRPNLTVLPATFPWYFAHPAGTRPASTADAEPAEEAISTSETALPPNRNVTAAAGAPARRAEPNPAGAAPAQADGLTWTALAAGLPVLMADSDAYFPLLTWVADATPLTRVSSAPRSCTALNIPDAAADVEPPADDPPLPLHPARPATTTGTSTPPRARHQRPSAISHPRLK